MPCTTRTVHGEGHDDGTSSRLDAKPTAADQPMELPPSVQGAVSWGGSSHLIPFTGRGLRMRPDASQPRCADLLSITAVIFIAHKCKTQRRQTIVRCNGINT